MPKVVAWVKENRRLVITLLVVVVLWYPLYTIVSRSLEWTTYVSQEPRLSVRYLKDFIVQKDYVNPIFSPDKEVGGVYFALPAPSGATRLGGANFSVEYSDKVTCTPQTFLPAATSTHQITSGMRTYDAARVFMEDGAGGTIEEAVYVIPNSSPCVAVRFQIRTNRTSGWDPQAPQISIQNRVASKYTPLSMRMIFYKMRDSVKVQ